MHLRHLQYYRYSILTLYHVKNHKQCMVLFFAKIWLIQISKQICILNMNFTKKYQNFFNDLKISLDKTGLESKACMY